MRKADNNNKRNSRETIPKLEQSQSPMTNHQIKALKKKVEKEKADLDNIIKKNKNIFSSFDNNLPPKKYAPGAVGPYDILSNDRENKVKGENSCLALKREDDPTIVSNRLKRRHEAIKRIEIRKKQKDLELRKSIDIRNENLRRSIEQIGLHQDKLQQAEKEKKIQIIVDEHKS